MHQKITLIVVLVGSLIVAGCSARPHDVQNSPETMSGNSTDAMTPSAIVSHMLSQNSGQIAAAKDLALNAVNKDLSVLAQKIESHCNFIAKLVVGFAAEKNIAISDAMYKSQDADSDEVMTGDMILMHPFMEAQDDYANYLADIKNNVHDDKIALLVEMISPVVNDDFHELEHLHESFHMAH